MKYTALNNRVVVKKVHHEKTESGIYLAGNEEQLVFEFEVLHTTEPYKELMGKRVMIQKYKVMQLPDDYGTAKVEDIECIKA